MYSPLILLAFLIVHVGGYFTISNGWYSQALLILSGVASLTCTAAGVAKVLHPLDSNELVGSILIGIGVFTMTALGIALSVLYPKNSGRRKDELDRMSQGRLSGEDKERQKALRKGRVVRLLFGLVFTLLVIACLAVVLLAYQRWNRLDEYNSVAVANFSAACINVIRSAQEHKHIRIFSTTPVNPSIEQVQGHTVEVVSNSDIVDNHVPFSGSYHNHHNSLVLNFASVQIFEGDRELGLHLVRTLAKVHPEFVWSSSNRGNRSIKDLLRALESRDSAIEEFLEEELRQWEWRIQEYGLPSDRSFEEPKRGKVTAIHDGHRRYRQHALRSGSLVRAVFNAEMQ